MPTSNRCVPPKGNPANARHIRSLRRRARLKWIWFSLAVAVVALGFGILVTIQFHAGQLANAAAEAEKQAIEHRASDRQPDPTPPARSSASVTPLSSTMSLAELLDRSLVDDATESGHFFPSFDIRDHVRANEPLRESPGSSDAIEREQTSEVGRTEPDTMTVQADTAAPSDEPSSVVPPRPRTEHPLRYDLRVPPSGANGAPVVILLHGVGGVRAAWNQWAATAQARGYIVCVPLASGEPAADSQAANRNPTKRWTNVDIPKIRNLANRLVQSLKADPQRVYLIGHSNGGFFAHEAGLRNPDVFSAIVSIGGGCNVRDISEDAKQVGVYIIHGTSDRAVPVEIARNSAERLRAAGVTNVILKEYPERGHDLFEDEMQAVFEWIENLRNSD